MDIPDIKIIQTNLVSFQFDLDNIKKLFLAFKKSKITKHVSSVACPHISVTYEYLDESLLKMVAYHTNEQKTIFIIYGVVHETADILKVENNLSEYMTKINNIIFILNDSAKDSYKQFLITISKQTETKSQNTQEIQPLQPTPQIPPQSTFNYNKIHCEEILIKHLRYYIPSDFRDIVRACGDPGKRKKNLKKIIPLNLKICRVSLSTNRAVSVLKPNRSDHNKLTLKIGVNNILDTSQRISFDWNEVSINEENIQHIKDAFVELNKWHNEKRDIRNKEFIEARRKDNFKPLE